MNLLLTTLQIALVVTVSHGSGDWDYSKSGKHGPAYWKDLDNYSTCGGEMQSPINIDNDIALSGHLEELNFKFYQNPASTMNIKNNGHSAQVELTANRMPVVTGGGLHGVFEFAQLHFHWGSDGRQGSEHTIDGQKFPIEMHLVHFNRDAGGNLGAAAGTGRPDALAVVGVMFEEVKQDNKLLAPIVEGLSHIKTANAKYNLTRTFALGDLVPKGHGNFYRYAGGLTTPGCNQVVKWTVMEQTLKISTRQLRAFRNIVGSGDHKIVNNYRPVQPMNGRLIFKNMPDMMHAGANSNLAASALTTLVTLSVLSRL